MGGGKNTRRKENLTLYIVTRFKQWTCIVYCDGHLYRLTLKSERCLSGTDLKNRKPRMVG